MENTQVSAPDLLEVIETNANARMRFDAEFKRGYMAKKHGQSRVQQESQDWEDGYKTRSIIAKATGV